MKVTLIAAQSLDGFITRHDQPGSNFTSAEDKQHFPKSLRDFDCQIMGAETFRVWQRVSNDPIHPKRPQWVMTRSPQAFAKAALPGWLEFTDEAPEKLLARIEAQDLKNCALLGGAKIHHLFFAAKRVNEVWLTIEPLIFGGGTPLVAGEISAQLRLLSSEKLSESTLLLKYSVI
jgi:dihydrofolate reductase